ncbi:hypothetical protein CR513_13870, partial [Mucuna pruriens]
MDLDEHLVKYATQGDEEPLHFYMARFLNVSMKIRNLNLESLRWLALNPTRPQRTQTSKLNKREEGLNQRVDLASSAIASLEHNREGYASTSSLSQL